MTKTLAARLLDFQSCVGTLAKGRTAKAGAFTYKYFDINTIIDEVKPILNDCGIVLLQPLGTEDGKLVMHTILINAENCTDKLQYTCPLSMLNDPQKQGGVVTYFRRYCLQSLLCLEAADDDAASASKAVTSGQVSRIYDLASEEKVNELLAMKKMTSCNDLTFTEANNLINHLKKQV